ncbi:MAG: serine hydrolase domain-containing protein [Akkermansiaceae bacterium]
MLENTLNQYLEKTEAGGILCAINIDGVIQTFSAGDIPSNDHQRPFYIYSISKTFTAVAMMRLCEKLGCFLDQSVLGILPHYQIPKEITTRQLLNHTSGLSDYFSQKEYQEAVHSTPENPWSYKKLMAVGLRDTPLFPAGESWSYSNPGYGMLKEIISIKSGMSYEEYIDLNIIKPLGLKSTRAFTTLDTEHQLLPGIDPNMSEDFRDRYDPGWIATGCFISTVEEITKFYHALFTEKLTSSDSLNQMTQLVELNFPLPEPKKAAYGLGLMSANNDPQGRNYGHGGGGPGYTTYARHYPNHQSKQISIALVINATLSMTPFDLTDEIFAKLA